MPLLWQMVLDIRRPLDSPLQVLRLYEKRMNEIPYGLQKTTCAKCGQEKLRMDMCFHVSQRHICHACNRKKERRQNLRDTVPGQYSWKKALWGKS